MEVYPHPEEPSHRHVFVRPQGDHGVPLPGLVISWQHAPVHHATQPSWNALVAVAPFGTALLVEWVAADRLIALRDPSCGGGV